MSTQCVHRIIGPHTWKEEYSQACKIIKNEIELTTNDDLYYILNKHIGTDNTIAYDLLYIMKELQVIEFLQYVTMWSMYVMVEACIDKSSSVVHSIHQTGPKYRSNNAGDGPEKTRDRKNWFPRFKSNWLGTFRSKQMFRCCECAITDPRHARYKGAEGKHCNCGSDQWHLAKNVEEKEYNRRMEMSKALGGMRYDEAVSRLKTMGSGSLQNLPSTSTTECGVKRSRYDVDGLSDEHSSRKRVCSDNHTMPVRQPTPVASTDHIIIDSKSHFGSGGYTQYDYNNNYYRSQRQGTGKSVPSMPMYPSKYAWTNGSYKVDPYISNGAETGCTPSGYEWTNANAPYTEEEAFTDILQGILEEDPSKQSHYGVPGGATPVHYPHDTSMGGIAGQYVQNSSGQYVRLRGPPSTVRPSVGGYYSQGPKRSSYSPPALHESIPNTGDLEYYSMYQSGRCVTKPDNRHRAMPYPSGPSTSYRHDMYGYTPRGSTV